MGMFDSLYADRRKGIEREWQTKAYDCQLDEFFVGDQMPDIEPYGLTDYQVAILGETPESRWTDSLATIRGGLLASLHDERDESLPLVNYMGHLLGTPETG